MENDDEKGDRDRLHHHFFFRIAVTLLVFVGSPVLLPFDVMTRYLNNMVRR